jgi:hypothetical protein
MRNMGALAPEASFSGGRRGLQPPHNTNKPTRALAPGHQRFFPGFEAGFFATGLPGFAGRATFPDFEPPEPADFPFDGAGFFATAFFWGILALGLTGAFAGALAGTFAGA